MGRGVEFLKRIIARVRSNGSQKKASVEMASLLGLAARYLQAQDYSAARRCLKRALESRPEMEDQQVLAGVLGWLLLTWQETDQYRESTEFFSEHISKYPGDAIAYTLRANSRWYAGELPAAIDDYSHALSVNSADVLALIGRGQVFVELDDYQRATQDLDHALEELGRLQNVPEDWKTTAKAYSLNGRAAASAGLGDFARALQLFDEAIALRPRNAWAYFNRAKAYERRGETMRALEDYKQALAMKEPKLNVLKRKHAEVKVSMLSV